MKTCYLLLVACIICVTGYSQKPGKAEKQLATARIYGRIIDASNSRGLAASSVQLVLRKADKSSAAKKDIATDGMLTLKNGDFNFENVSLSPDLVIIISALGFKKLELPLGLQIKGAKKQTTDLDLGNIKVNIDPKTLETVTVTSNKSSMSLGIDRKVFNVEKSLAATGGTAEDVIRTVPSLSVDIDGNVTLRNSSPQVFVDGRPTTMTLDQIPADAIQSVEIITNPSAKFDASGGGGGILNIVLKKNRKAGYNGSVKAGIDQRGKYSYGGDLNVRQNKVNFFAGINYRQRKSISTGHSERLTILDNANTELNQSDNGIQQKANFFVRAGVDYLLDNRNTFTVSGFFGDGHANSNNSTRLLIDTMHANGKRSSFSERTAFPGSTYSNKGLTIGYKHLFSKAGKEWTADLNYGGTDNVRSNTISTSSYNLINGPLSKQFGQLVSGNGSHENLTFQSDFVNPLNETSRLELGARLQLKGAANTNNISYRNENGAFAKISQLSSFYENHYKVFAAYGTFSRKINRFGYQLGLRVESSQYNGTVSTTALSGADTLQLYGNKFPLSLFPSLFLTHHISKDQEMQLSFTRRINRPEFWQLFPFTDYSDSLNLSKGNPDLKPEFTYSAELAYEKTFSGKNIFLASAYFKYTDQLITPFQEKELNVVTGRENLVSTFINANSSYTGGLEFIYRQSVYKWWEMTSNLNLFSSRINIGNENVIAQKAIYSWFAKFNNTFKLPKNLSFELSSEYSSRRVLPQGSKNSGGKDGLGNGQVQSSSQGFIRHRLEVDAALRYDFLKNKKASVTFHIKDIFRTDASNIYAESIYFRQNTYRLKDPQYFRLQFAWRFGKFDASLFKRKHNKAVEEEADEVE